ncbi:MAG: hypothetical protein D6730_13765 [Bacteroidetes bacterium]|nr:MAG: hypothetical protein D6730_13765 [Bacteroidota bacterium]
MRKPLLISSLLTLALASGLLSLPFVPIGESNETGFLTFLGHLHPLLVHFPIVLLMLVPLLEAYVWWKKTPALRTIIDGLLASSLLSSLAAALAGYLLYRSGDYSGSLVNQHLWGGVVLSVACLLTGLLYVYARLQVFRRAFQLYVGLLLFSNLALIYTGHLGGSLTHGADFLTRALPEWGGSPEIENPDELRLFEEVVMGIFQAKCLNCHNPHKAKGGLVMSSYQALLAGGDSQKSMLVARQPDSSELYRRIVLPETHEDHMPPEGKPGLTEAELAIIHGWIAESGQPNYRLDSASVELQQAVQAYMPQLLRFQRKRDEQGRELAQTYAELKEICRELHLHVEPDPDADSLLFALSMQLPPAYVDDRSIQRLMPYREAFSKISLPAAQITDEGAYFLSRFPNLRELYLQKTCLSGESLIYLKTLPNLEVLNLSFTDVDDVAVFELPEYPSLRQVFLFQTLVGANLITALDKRLQQVKVMNEEGPYY